VGPVVSAHAGDIVTCLDTAKILPSEIPVMSIDSRCTTEKRKNRSVLIKDSENELGLYCSSMLCGRS
jgi:hypothetical protein